MSKLLSYIIKEFEYEYGSKPEIIVSAPGRLDFLNTHQDYKGLPVVSVGINLRTYVAIKQRTDTICNIISVNLKKEGSDYLDRFNLKNLTLRESAWFGNYLRAAIMTLFKKGHQFDGFDCLIYSEVPIAAGLASSAALTVSFIGAINELYKLSLSKKDIAETAYYAEHDVMNIPCGRLDQYGSTYGGIIKIETKSPYNIEELPPLKGSFVVIDSGIKHTTAQIHPIRQAEINQGLRMLLQMNDLPKEIKEKLGKEYYETKWEEINLKQIEPYLNRLPKEPKNRILFTFKMHELTTIALNVIRNNTINLKNIEKILEINKQKTSMKYALQPKKSKLTIIGVIMNYQHDLLRDLYEVSLPELEIIRNTALNSGALGVKLSGAGLGGSLIALVKTSENGKVVLKNSLKVGAKRGWIVNIDSGLRDENF